MQFEFYVLNYNINARKVENFNIFSNYSVNEEMVKETRKYLRGPKNYKYIDYGIRDEDKKVLYGFEAFCEKLRRTIMWQEWSRCEYEISVGDLFEKDPEKYEKWDCYKQALPNIPMIAREIIYQYKQQSKK